MERKTTWYEYYVQRAALHCAQCLNAYGIGQSERDDLNVAFSREIREQFRKAIRSLR